MISYVLLILMGDMTFPKQKWRRNRVGDVSQGVQRKGVGEEEGREMGLEFEINK